MKLSLSLLVMLPVAIFLSPVYSNTQWVQTNGPYGGNIRCFAVSGTNLPAGQAGLFAGTFGGVFLSTNNGTSWTPANTGLTNADVLCFTISGNVALTSARRSHNQRCYNSTLTLWKIATSRIRVIDRPYSLKYIFCQAYIGRIR